MARSQRADEHLFEEICGRFDYQPVVFSTRLRHTRRSSAHLPYHVLMCMTDRYAVLCLDAIDDMVEHDGHRYDQEKWKRSDQISEAQKHQFGGNMLLVKGDGDALHLVMSTSAHKCLTNT